MAKIYGGTITTPINPEMFGGNANTIKNSVSGSIVTIPDISPIEHNLDIKLTGEVGVEVFDISQISSNDTIQVNVENGTITTGDAKGYTTESFGALYPEIKDGDKVTISYKSNGKIYVGEGLFDESEENGIIYLRFIASENYHLTSSIAFSSETTYTNISIKVARPIVDFSDVEVISSGKNLFNVDVFVSNEKGITNNGDGTLTVTQYPSYTDRTLADLFPALRVGDTIIFNVDTNYTDYYHKMIYLSSTTHKIRIGTPYTIKKGDLSDKVCLYCYRADGVNYPTTFSNMQIELGTVKTEYEPYREPQIVRANADGAVKGLKSIYPTTVLKADTEGVIINTTYNVDTKTYIDRKFAELSQALLNL
jgi:hypothetical protein